jgi:hypothetical protein
MSKSYVLPASLVVLILSAVFSGSVLASKCGGLEIRLVEIVSVVDSVPKYFGKFSLSNQSCAPIAVWAHRSNRGRLWSEEGAESWVEFDSADRSGQWMSLTAGSSSGSAAIKQAFVSLERGEKSEIWVEIAKEYIQKAASRKIKFRIFFRDTLGVSRSSEDFYLPSKITEGENMDDLANPDASDAMR